MIVCQKGMGFFCSMEINAFSVVRIKNIMKFYREMNVITSNCVSTNFVRFKRIY